MEKLTSILAVVPTGLDVPILLHKTVALARRFGARVEMLTWDSDVKHDIKRLCEEHQYPEVHISSAHRGAAPLHERVLRRISQLHPDLVVKTPAGPKSLRRFTLDANDWELANRCPAPLLLVRPQPWGDMLRLAVAVDVADTNTTDLARRLLHTAGFVALGSQGELDVLYSEREAKDEALRMERAVRLAQLVREFHVGCERIEMFAGEPEIRLPPLVASRRYDVLVLGGQTRRAGLATLMPGTVSRMVESTESDVLLVRTPADPESARAFTAREANEPASAIGAN